MLLLGLRPIRLRCGFALTQEKLERKSPSRIELPPAKERKLCCTTHSGPTIRLGATRNDIHR
jgi:hypothetical protein